MAKTFALAWIDAVAGSPVSTSAKAVALAMVTHADYATGENMHAGNARLAAMSGLSDRQVRRCVGELRDAGLIAWDGVPTVPGRARKYQLTIPNGGHGCPVNNPERRSPMSAVEAGTADMGDRNGGHTRPERRTPMATHQSPTRALPAGAFRAPAGEAPRNTHQYVPDTDTGACQGCGLPAANARHSLTREAALT